MHMDSPKQCPKWSDMGISGITEKKEGNPPHKYTQNKGTLKHTESHNLTILSNHNQTMVLQNAATGACKTSELIENSCTVII